jgi:hypothetical protein
MTEDTGMTEDHWDDRGSLGSPRNYVDPNNPAHIKESERLSLSLAFNSEIITA